MSLLTLITMLVGLVGFVLRFLNPAFPFDNTQILAFVLFVLGLGGIVPTVARLGLRATLTDLWHSLAFWTLVAGVVEYLVHSYIPSFPLDQINVLAVILYVLSEVGIIPQLRRLKVIK